MTLDTPVIINLNLSVLMKLISCNVTYSQCLLNCFCLVMSPISHTVVYEAVSKPREPQFEF